MKTNNYIIFETYKEMALMGNLENMIDGFLRERNLTTAQFFDLLLVPSSYIRYYARHTEVKSLNRELKVAAYLMASSLELVRLMPYAAIGTALLK